MTRKESVEYLARGAETKWIRSRERLLFFVEGPSDRIHTARFFCNLHNIQLVQVGGR